VDAQPDEVVFTSGATESNNLAILGLAAYGERSGKRHVVSTQIEHKAVLEPLEALAQRGFQVTLVPPNSGGWVDPDDVWKAVRPDTVLVTVMHVNNETGVVQPLAEIASLLAGHDAYLHTDAAQGFGKEVQQLRLERVDMLSASAHKIYGPKGVGALVVRRRGFERIPLEPLSYGGGQERGLRPGTLPAPLIVGLGGAAEVALRDLSSRRERCSEMRLKVLKAFREFGAELNGDETRALPSCVNLSLPRLDSEAAMLALKGIAAISNGSACTSQSHQPSHVLKAMQLSESRIRGALRVSWCHLTEEPDWGRMREALQQLC
jgi:cysteine desulfurase